MFSKKAAPTPSGPSPLYTFSINTLRGQPYDLGALKNKAVLIVNTASKCGFTPQYEGLEQVWKEYKDRGLVVLGVPCNQFGKQEPGSHEEIGEFCQVNFGVTFPILEKVDVNGDEAHPLYKWLKSQKSQLMMEAIKWNFEKFLVGKDGWVIDRYSSLTKPESLKKDIEAALEKPDIQ